MTQLIAVIDGSVYAMSVCDHLAWAARSGSNDVCVMHVLGRRDGSGEHTNLSGSIGLGARSELLAELAELDEKNARLALKRGRAILDGAAERLREAGVANVSTRLRHGELVETVDEFEQDTQLLVIGKRGEAAEVSGEHLGSNLERIVRATHQPTLVAAQSFRPIRRALIAYDGGASANKAVSGIAASGLFEGVDCHLITVGDDTPDRQTNLKLAAATLSDSGLSASFEVRSGTPESVIAKAMEAEGFDLLVMGAYGHSRIRNLIIGSTTTQMLQSCPTSVLLFR